MTSAQITAQLTTLPRPQWDMLMACLSPGYRPKGKMQWRTFDRLIRKGLLVQGWDTTLHHGPVYQAPPEVRLAVRDSLAQRDASKA